MWLKDGRPLSDTLEIIKVPESMSILKIQRLTAADSGTYTCVASNKAGIASVSKEMVVYGKYVLLRNKWQGEKVSLSSHLKIHFLQPLTFSKVSAIPCYQGADVSDSVQGGGGGMFLVILLKHRANSERRTSANRFWFAVPSAVFVCLFKLLVDATELETMYTNCLKGLKSN